MRKALLILILIQLLGFPKLSIASSDGEKQISIKAKTEDRFQHKHRAPTKSPIEASYNSFVSGIAITFLQDLGNVTVNVSNHSTGEYLEGTMNATTGVTMLPISGTDGFYTITFTVSDGKEYYGEFEL